MVERGSKQTYAVKAGKKMNTWRVNGMDGPCAEVAQNMMEKARIVQSHSRIRSI